MVDFSDVKIPFARFLEVIPATTGPLGRFSSDWYKLPEKATRGLLGAILHIVGYKVCEPLNSL